MANKDLEQINSELDNARYYLRNAAKIAKNAGDGTGATQITKHEEEVKKTQEDFSKKGK
jgi:hypothetical protein